MMNNVPIITVGFDGYLLEDTLKGVSKTNSSGLSLCAVDGLTQHVNPERMSIKEWENVKRLINENNLTFYGLEGHCDLSNSDNLERIRKRIEFTHFLGGKYLDLDGGQKSKIDDFFKNISKIIKLAEKFNIIVCFETHKGLIETGKGSLKLLKRIGSPYIRISYDPANVYFYSNGKINPSEDIKYILDFIYIIHLKGVSHNDSKTKWKFPQMEKSNINFKEFFHILKQSNYNNMFAIEVETIFNYTKKKGFYKEKNWPIANIIEAYNIELKYLYNNYTRFQIDRS